MFARVTASDLGEQRGLFAHLGHVAADPDAGLDVVGGPDVVRLTRHVEVGAVGVLGLVGAPPIHAVLRFVSQCAERREAEAGLRRIGRRVVGERRGELVGVLADRAGVLERSQPLAQAVRPVLVGAKDLQHVGRDALAVLADVAGDAHHVAGDLVITARLRVEGLEVLGRVEGRAAGRVAGRVAGGASITAGELHEGIRRGGVPLRRVLDGLLLQRLHHLGVRRQLDHGLGLPAALRSTVIAGRTAVARDVAEAVSARLRESGLLLGLDASQLFARPLVGRVIGLYVGAWLQERIADTLGVQLNRLQQRVDEIVTRTVVDVGPVGALGDRVARPAEGCDVLHGVLTNSSRSPREAHEFGPVDSK